MLGWQRDALAVALELLPDGSPAYRRVIITVPRQSGKSTTADALCVSDLTYTDRRTYYTAQTGRAASERFRLNIAPLYQQTPLRSLGGRVRWQIGAESIDMPGGARLQVFPPKEDALHGNQIDRGLIDEAWSLDIAGGRMLEQAMIPAGRTRRDFSLWVLSTAGTARSAWLAEQVAMGRDYARAGRTDTVCYFEWSADGVDPDDIDQVIGCHPAVELGDRGEDAIREAWATMDRGEFMRSFGNVWSAGDDVGIPPGLWADTAVALPLPGTDAAAGVVLGISAARDQSRASIVASWPATHGGVPLVGTAVVDARPGMSWVADALPDICARRRVRATVYDATDPVAGILATIRGPLNPRPEPLGWPDVSKASALYLERLRDRRLAHVPDPDFDAAARNAAQRYSGDRWTWGRRVSSGPIDPLIGSTLSAYRVDVPTHRTGKPEVRSL